MTVTNKTYPTNERTSTLRRDGGEISTLACVSLAHCASKKVRLGSMVLLRAPFLPSAFFGGGIQTLGSESVIMQSGVLPGLSSNGCLLLDPALPRTRCFNDATTNLKITGEVTARVA